MTRRLKAILADMRACYTQGTGEHVEEDFISQAEEALQRLARPKSAAFHAFADWMNKEKLRPKTERRSMSVIQDLRAQAEEIARLIELKK